MNIHNTQGALYVAYATRREYFASDNWILAKIIDNYVEKQRPSKKLLNHIKRK